MEEQPPRQFAVLHFTGLRFRWQGRWIRLAALVIVLTISASASLPLLWYGVPQGYDTPIHFARIGALDHALRQGEWYPRWLPNLLLGHGYPLLNYYAPASYYVAVALLRLGLGPHNAYSLAYVIFLLTAGVGMYTWARDLFRRESAAILAAAAYSFSPYLLLNVYIRGSFAEALAQALLPWVFWAFRRLMLAEQPVCYVPVAVLVLGGLAVSHTITLLFAPVILVIYLITLVNAAGYTRANLRAVGASLLMAMGVSAFFWLPLILERGYLSEAAYGIAIYGWLPGNVWHWDNFLQPSLVYHYDFSGLMQLGVIQVVLALAGFALALTMARHAPFAAVRRAELWMLLWVMAVAAIFVGAWSLPIWRSSRILATVQFPWRLLVIISLSMAIAVGGFTAGIQRRGWRLGVGVAVLALVMWAHYPRLAHLSFFDATSVELGPDHTAQIEQYKGAEEGGENTSSVQEFKPRWVARNLVFEAPTDTAISGEPPTVEIEVLAANGWTKEVVVELARESLLRFHDFYFPGWLLREGERIDTIYPSTNLGLTTAELEAGNHHITLDWAGTVVQQVGVAMTLLALAALVAWCWHYSLWRGWMVLAAALLVGVLAAAFMEPRPAPVLQPKQALATEGIELVGLRYEQSTRDSLDLYPIWFVTAPLPDELEVLWQLADAQGKVVMEWRGQFFYNSYSADNFPTQTLVDDAYRLELPGGLPAGSYMLRGQLVMEDAPALATVEITEVTLRRPTAPQAAPAHALDLRFEEGITLNGYDVHFPRLGGDRPAAGNPPVVASGERVEITLWWSADSAPDENFHGFVHLVDSQGRPVEQVDQLPGPLFQPPMLWSDARPAPDVYALHIPAETPSGLYWPWVGLYRHPSENRLVVVDSETGEMTERDHVQLAPIKVVNDHGLRPTTEAAVSLGDFAEWIGYDLQMAGESLTAGESMTLTLFYEARAASDVGYTRFVHVVHPEAGVVTQADGVPQIGANPTWSWQPGEVILDPVIITLPPDAPAGDYQLLLGFYAPENGGARLSLWSDEAGRIPSGDYAVIATVTVE